MNNIDIRLPKAAADAAGADGAVAPAVDTVYRDKAVKAAEQFESFFISHMLRQMRSGTREMAGEDSVFKDPINQDMQEMADNLVADKMAGQRAFGIADAILRQLLPANPTSSAAAATKAASDTTKNIAPAQNIASALNKSD